MAFPRGMHGPHVNNSMQQQQDVGPAVNNSMQQQLDARASAYRDFTRDTVMNHLRQSREHRNVDANVAGNFKTDNGLRGEMYIPRPERNTDAHRGRRMSDNNYKYVRERSELRVGIPVQRRQLHQTNHTSFQRHGIQFADDDRMGYATLTNDDTNKYAALARNFRPEKNDLTNGRRDGIQVSVDQ